MTSPATRPEPRSLRIDYGNLVEPQLTTIEEALADLDLGGRASTRWLALKLLEGDAVARAMVTGHEGSEAVLAAAAAAARQIRDSSGEEPSMLIADRRFSWANRLARRSVERELTLRSRTERLDDVLTSRWAGIPIFLGLMWVVFTLVTDVAGPLVDWIDGVVSGPLSALAGAVISGIGLGGSWFESLVVGGVIGGVGSVLVFVPVLAVLYVALGLLEDSGYMARAAFLLDRLMRPIGLTGKSFLPLLLGFGCNVPGVYATRVLDRRRDRVVTSLLVPFVSCAARLPVYVLLAAVFFPTARGTVVFVMYLASIAVVLVVGALLDRTLMRGERNDSFILELPPYRRPSAPVLWSYVWLRIRSFISRAGTVIFACSLVVWFTLAIPVRGSGTFADTTMEDSLFAGISRQVAPTLAPAGLDSWQVAGTLLSGFVAKEVVVSTMEQAFGDDAAGSSGAPEPTPGHRPLEELAASARDLGTALRDAALAIPGIVGIDLGDGDDAEPVDIAESMHAAFSSSSRGHPEAAAAAFLAIVLLYVPCMATVAAIRHEIGGRWAAVSIGLNLGVAWIVGIAVFQVARLLGGG